MAFSTSTPHASTVQTDAPLICYGNALKYPSAGHPGRWNTVGTMTAADESDALEATTRAYDNFGHLATRGNATQTTWYLNFYTDPGKPFDTVAILGHDFGTAPVEAVTVTVETADNDAFTTNLTTIATTASWSIDRRVVWVLASQYDNVERVRIKFVTSLADRHRIGEVLLAKRFQIPATPVAPYDNQPEFSNIRRARTLGGVIADTRLSGPAREQTINLRIDKDAEHDGIKTAWRESCFGAEPFLWVESPDADPTTVEAYHMRWPPNFTLPLTSPRIREGQIAMVEQAPFFREEIT